LHETLIAFLVFEGFTDLSLKRGQTFIIWFDPLLLDYDVSMHGIVELVVVNPMSPRSSKTESGCSSYNHFCIAISSRPDYPPSFSQIISPLKILLRTFLRAPDGGTDYWASFGRIIWPSPVSAMY
jgi:hypothetical protein